MSAWEVSIDYLLPEDAEYEAEKARLEAFHNAIGEVGASAPHIREHGTRVVVGATVIIELSAGDAFKLIDTRLRQAGAEVGYSFSRNPSNQIVRLADHNSRRQLLTELP